MKNLKSFDLQEALSGKPVRLRDGAKAYVRYHETELPVAADMRLMGYLLSGSRMAWCENGDYYMTGSGADYDIIGMYPQTRIINGFEVPAPVAEPPKPGCEFYVAEPSRTSFWSWSNWSGDERELEWLSRGLVFLSKEDAIATAKAMLGIDPYSKDGS